MCNRPNWPVAGLSVLLLAVTACQDSPPQETQAHAPGGHEDTHGEHWDYGPHNGPDRWADLDEAFILCRNGREQSPIDLGVTVAADVPALTLEYQPVAVRFIRHEHVVDVIDNGHTIQFNYDEGSVLGIGDESFELVQFHFHAPSEHTVNGRHAAMEMHLVHQGANGALAVLGVMIEQGEHNAALDPFWDQLPDQAGTERHFEHITVDIDDLLPENHNAYRYEGSLTTPPCSEGVKWLVAVEPIELSAQQVRVFTDIIGQNNRPVQELGDRTVSAGSVAEP